jgi:hypothetical protein
MYVLIDQYRHTSTYTGMAVIGVYSTSEKAVKALEQYAIDLELELTQSTSDSWYASGNDTIHNIVNMDLELDKIYEWPIEEWV